MDSSSPENVVENYGWSVADGPQSCGYITPEILRALGLLRAKKVLDVGAGNGALCREIFKAGYGVVGLEYDKAGFKVSRESNPEIHCYNMGVQDSAAELLAAEGLFDVVVSTEVVEHLFSPHHLPIFANTVLCDMGHLIITTPYHGYLKNLVISILGKWDEHFTALWHGGHIKFWSRSTITRLLEENGFKVTRFSGVGRFPYLWKSMVIIAQKCPC